MRSSASSPKKRVVFSTYDDINNPYYGGGGARAIREVALRLTEKFDVTVITGNYKGATNSLAEGIDYKRIGPAFLGPKIGQLAFHFLLPYYVMRLHFDIWVESFTPPFSTSCVQVFTKKPAIGLVHMLSAEDMTRKYHLPFRLIENQGLKTYRTLIVVTENSLAKLESINRAATKYVIPNGVQVRSSKPRSSSIAKPYILYVGRLENNQKGLDLLLQAYASIHRYSNYRLVIAGSGVARDERKLRKSIIEHGLEGKVDLMGRIDGKVKDELYRKCSFVVIPSRLETFCMVVLEAMSYGKPTVSFDIKGLTWTPENCVIKAKPFDSIDFGNKISELINNKQLYDRMALATRQSIEQYSWDKISEKYRDAIQETLRNHIANSEKV